MKARDLRRTARRLLSKGGLFNVSTGHKRGRERVERALGWELGLWHIGPPTGHRLLMARPFRTSAGAVPTADGLDRILAALDVPEDCRVSLESTAEDGSLPPLPEGGLHTFLWAVEGPRDFALTEHMTAMQRKLRLDHIKAWNPDADAGEEQAGEDETDPDTDADTDAVTDGAGRTDLPAYDPPPGW